MSLLLRARLSSFFRKRREERLILDTSFCFCFVCNSLFDLVDKLFILWDIDSSDILNSERFELSSMSSISLSFLKRTQLR